MNESDYNIAVRERGYFPLSLEKTPAMSSLNSEMQNNQTEIPNDRTSAIQTYIDKLMQARKLIIMRGAKWEKSVQSKKQPMTANVPNYQTLIQGLEKSIRDIGGFTRDSDIARGQFNKAIGSLDKDTQKMLATLEQGTNSLTSANADVKKQIRFITGIPLESEAAVNKTAEVLELLKAYVGPDNHKQLRLEITNPNSGNPAAMAMRDLLVNVAISSEVDFLFETKLKSLSEGAKLEYLAQKLASFVSEGKITEVTAKTIAMRKLPNTDLAEINKSLSKATGEKRMNLESKGSIQPSPETGTVIKSLETIKKKKGLEARLAEEVKTIKNAIESSERDPKQQKRKAFDLALRKILIQGEIIGVPEESLEKSIVGALEKFGISEPLSPENKPFYMAVKGAIDQKRGELQYVDQIVSEGRNAYKSKVIDSPLGPKRSEDDFVANYVGKHLVRRILGNEADKLSDAELEGVTFLYPSYQKESIDGVTNTPITVPLIVAPPEIMAKLAEVNNPEKAPRGMFVSTKDRLQHNSNGAPIERTIDMIVMQGKEDDVYKNTFSHELVHWLITASRRTFTEQYAADLSRNSFGPLFTKFKGELLEKHPEIAQMSKEEEVKLMDEYRDLLTTSDLPANLDELEKIDIKSTKYQGTSAQLFAEFLIHGGGKEHLSRNKKALNSFSSPLEELTTICFDQQNRMGLNELGIDHYDPKIESMRSTLALMRLTNEVFDHRQEKGDSPKYHQDDSEYFSMMVLRNIDAIEDLAPSDVMAFLEKIRDVSEGHLGSADESKEHAKAILKSAIPDIKTLSDRFKLVGNESQNQTQLDIANELSKISGNTFVASDFEKIGEIIANSEGKAGEVYKKTFDQIYKSGDINKVLMFLNLFILGASSDEQKAGVYGVIAEKGIKKSGFNSQARKVFDFDNRFGDWGKQNSRYTNLEGIPVVGPIAQSVIDSVNPMSRIYMHYKDPGPFREIPFLNFKYLGRDGLGIFTEDPLHRMESTDPAEGFSHLFGISWFRNKRFNDWRDSTVERYNEAQKAENIRAVEENRLPKNKMRFIDRKWLWFPQGVVEPGVGQFYDVTIKMLQFALTNAGVPASEIAMIQSVIGGISAQRGLEYKLSDFSSEVDEYRSNRKFVKFLSDPNSHAIWRDQLNKSEEWIQNQIDFMQNDSFYFDGTPQGRIDINVKENFDRVKKGTMTKNMLDMIVASVDTGNPNKYNNSEINKSLSDAEDLQDSFSVIGQAMMKADNYWHSKENKTEEDKSGYTMEDLIQQLIYADNDPRLFEHREYPDPKTGKMVWNQEAMKFIMSPQIEVRVGPNENDVVKLTTFEAKKFITYYYLARLRKITELGVWGMTQKVAAVNRETGKVGTEDMPCAALPEREDREYDFNQRRVLTNTDNPRYGYMFTSNELYDPMRPLTHKVWEMLNGKTASRSWKYTGKKKPKGSDQTREFVDWKVENMAHDAVTGAIDGAVESKKIAYRFMIWLRRTEAYRDMAKSKKDLWEGVNNVDDQARTLALIYTLASLLVFPGLPLPGFVPITLLAWSLLISPMINRYMEGWSQRDFAAVEAGNTLRDQYAPQFYKLADDKEYHPVNEYRHYTSQLEAVKNVYKRVLTDLSKSGTPKSNYIARKAHDLLGVF